MLFRIFKKLSARRRGEKNPSSLSPKKQGIALLLIIIIMTGVLTISLSVFEIVVSNLILTGTVANSYYALYVTDRIVEKLLFLDRSGPPYNAYPTASPAGGITITFDESGGKTANIEYTVDHTSGTTMEVHGRYPATGNKDAVKRAFRITY